MTRCQRQVSSRWAVMIGSSAAPVSGGTRFTARTRFGACCRAVACGTSAIAHAASTTNRTTFFNAVDSFLVRATTGAVNHVGERASSSRLERTCAPRPLSRLALR